MKYNLLFICLLFSLNSLAKEWIVALDGSGDFVTIQSAINAMPDHSSERLIIRIKSGDYFEKLVIPSWKTNIIFIGESKEQTRIVWNDHAGKGSINTFTSFTVLVQGNGFRAENITFENNAGAKVGQAVALHVEADRAVFINCNIIGNQDTLYTGVDNSRQYYLECYIEGTTDYIFGPATVVFDRCRLYSKKNSYITAASTPANQKYGYVFLDCQITASESVTKLYLGRPWRPYAKTVFIRCDMDAPIAPEGWHNWNKPDVEKTTYYAEYKSTGKGADSKAREGWAYQLADSLVHFYELRAVFSEDFINQE